MPRATPQTSASERLRCCPALFEELQFQLPIVLRHFPTGLAHGLMFGTQLIQDRIRVVEMNEHFAPHVNTLQQTQTLFRRDMSHLVRRLARAQNTQQFVIAPESAVEKKQVHMTDLSE